VFTRVFSLEKLSTCVFPANNRGVFRHQMLLYSLALPLGVLAAWRSFLRL
jgi:hypothetical protein